MTYHLAVFRARTQTLNFANIMKSYGVPIAIVNTPRNISVSCGISVKFPTQFKDTAQNIISRRQFSTFAGFYALKN